MSLAITAVIYYFSANVSLAVNTAVIYEKSPPRQADTRRRKEGGRAVKMPKRAYQLLHGGKKRAYKLMQCTAARGECTS